MKAIMFNSCHIIQKLTLFTLIEYLFLFFNLGTLYPIHAVIFITKITMQKDLKFSISEEIKG